jgi:hypothetical protein
LRLLRVRLIELNSDQPSITTVFADARALLQCRAPDGALRVLARFSPAIGEQRDQWLLLQWQAASAGLDHRLAAAALRRLSGGSAQALSSRLLPLGESRDPTNPPPQRSALELQAMQLESMGESVAAAALLLQEDADQGVTAARRREAGRLLSEAGKLEQAELTSGEALDRSAAAAAWGLSGQLLEDQRSAQLVQGNSVAAAVTNGRRERLSRRIDDAMGLRAALLARLADGTANPALVQRLIDRQDPLERRRGGDLDQLIALDMPEVDRLARLDLAVRLAQQLGHGERLQDLLSDQEAAARLVGDAWLLDRVNRLAVQVAGGNPLREREALDRRQRELAQDPALGATVWDLLTPSREQHALENLRQREQSEARLAQRVGYAPYQGSFALPPLLEDLERLRLAKAAGLAWLLPPAQFGLLPRQLEAAEFEQQQRLHEQAVASVDWNGEEREQGQARFADLVQKLQRREQLAKALDQDLAAGQLAPTAIARQQEWLALERHLDPRGPFVRELAGFGRSPEGLRSLQDLHRQQDRLWLGARHQELLALQQRRQLLDDQLLQAERPRWQPRAPITAPQVEAVLLTRLWREFRDDPTEITATQLQDLAARRSQEGLELEALRLRLSRLLPAAAADVGVVNELRLLEGTLRSPLSPGGHTGPPPPSHDPASSR